MKQRSFGRSYDRVAPTYDRSRFGTGRGRLFAYLREKLLEKAVQRFPRTGRAFDLACGTGILSEWLLGKGYLTISGDLSKGMLEKAKEKFSRMNNSGHVLQLNASNLPFKAKSFDIITSFRFLNLLPPPVRINIHKEASRVGRNYYLITYALNSSYQRFRGRIKSVLGFSSREGADVHPATCEEIVKELKEAKIEVVGTWPIFRLLTSEFIILGKIGDSGREKTG